MYVADADNNRIQLFTWKPEVQPDIAPLENNTAANNTAANNTAANNTVVRPLENTTVIIGLEKNGLLKPLENSSLKENSGK